MSPIDPVKKGRSAIWRIALILILTFTYCPPAWAQADGAPDTLALFKARHAALESLAKAGRVSTETEIRALELWASLQQALAEQDLHIGQTKVAARQASADQLAPLLDELVADGAQRERILRDHLGQLESLFPSGAPLAPANVTLKPQDGEKETVIRLKFAPEKMETTRME